MTSTEKSSNGATSFAPASAFKTNAYATSTSHPAEADTSRRRKRDRTENEENATVQTARSNSQTDSSGEVRASKRKRDTGFDSGADEDPHNASGATETEDISEEVQRRLELREERRRRKGTTHSEKRKRDSLHSSGSVSPDTTRHPKKRARTGGELQGEDTMSEQGSEWMNEKFETSKS